MLIKEKAMLSMTEGNGEVIVCEIIDGMPVGLEEYFTEECGRDREDFTTKLVDAPILIAARCDLDVQAEVQHTR